MNHAPTLGPYLLERELGAGAMGVVYLARHPQLDTRYALKVLKPDLCEPSDAERFQRELESMAAISTHPNVVRIHTSGLEAGRLYYVMDLIDGEDLQRSVNRGPMDPRKAARIVRDVAGAVTALHEAGYIHRDIKPENVLLDRSGVPFLTDFGLARLFADEKNRLTMTGELVGTPAYMAPEQALGYTELGPGTDVYSLGVLLYVLLAGKPPIEGNSKLAVLSKVASGELVPLSASAPGAPQQLAEVCARCFKLSMEDRPSAAEVAQALDDYLSGRTPRGESQTAGEVAQQRKLTLLLVALCVLALVLGGVAVVVSIQRRDAQSATSLMEIVERVEGDAERALTHGEANAELLAEVTSTREELEGLAAERPEEALVDRLLRLLFFEGELTLRLGDVDQARERLRELLTLPDRVKLTHRQKQEWRSGTEVLEVELALHEGGPVEAKLANALSKAIQQWPKRTDLARLQIRQDLSAGQPAEALRRLKTLLARHVDVPADLRCLVLLAAGDLRGANELMEEVGDATLRARLALRVGEHLVDRVTAKKVTEEERQELRSPELAQAREKFAAAASALGTDDPDRVHTIAFLRERLEALCKLAFRREDRSTRAQSMRKVAQILRVAELILALRELEVESALDPELMQDFRDHSAVMVWAPELADLELLLSVDDSNPQLLVGYVLQVNDKYLHRNVPLSTTPERAERIFRKHIEVARKQEPGAVAFAQEQLGRFYGYLGRADDLIRFIDEVGEDSPKAEKLRIKLSRRAAAALRVQGKLRDGRRVLEPILKQYPEETLLLFDHMQIGVQLHNQTGQEDAELLADLLDKGKRILDLASPGHPSWDLARIAAADVLVPNLLREGRREEAQEFYEQMLRLADSAPADRRPGVPRLIAGRIRTLLEDGAQAQALALAGPLLAHLERDVVYLPRVLESGGGALRITTSQRLLKIRKLLEETDAIRTIVRDSDVKGLGRLATSVELLPH